MSSEKVRIEWIDIAKGLMIIGMVLNHIPIFCRIVGVDLLGFQWSVIGHTYGVFTMQAFFLLSGYTTNFDKSPRKFIWSQIKGLAIPYVFFCVCRLLIDYFLWDSSVYWNVKGESYFFLVEGYWFLTALLFAKVLEFYLRKCLNNSFLEVMGGGNPSYNRNCN